MSDLLILHILSTKENYDRFSKYIKNTSKEITLVLKDMGTYLNTSSKDTINWDAFSGWFLHVQHPTMSSDMQNVYREIFEALDEVEYEESETDAIIRGFVDRTVAERITNISVSVADGEHKHTIEDIHGLLDERDAELKIVNDEGFAEWGKPITHVQGDIRWRLDELNKACGPIGKGDFIILGARPDSGKTTFLASEATFFAGQLAETEKVLWLNNEERLEKVQSRILTAALGIPYEDIERNWVKAYEDYKAAINGDVDKIVLKDISGAYTSQIEALVKRVQPSVIIIDQLRKVHGFERSAGNETSRQELIFNWARDLAKLHAPVLTVHQADGTAENQKWIDMSQLHMSKTGIQGEADAIITLGRTQENPNSRYIYVPKNKMRGEDPLLRNGKFEVEIDGPRARFKGAVS